MLWLCKARHRERTAALRGWMVHTGVRWLKGTVFPQDKGRGRAQPEVTQESVTRREGSQERGQLRARRARTLESGTQGRGALGADVGPGWS